MNAPNGYRIMKCCWEDTYPACSVVRVTIAIPERYFTHMMREYSQNDWDWEISRHCYDEILREVEAMRFDERTQTWENW